MYRLLIVDDEQITLDGLRELFTTTDNIDVDVFTAHSGIEAIEIIKKTGIDIVISDIKMPGTDGIKLAQTIQMYWPSCKVIFLTGFNKSRYSIAAVKYGVVDYIMKTESDDVIINSVKRAINMIIHDNNEVIKNAGTSEAELYIKSVLQNDFLFAVDTQADINLASNILHRTSIDPEQKFVLLTGKINIDNVMSEEYESIISKVIRLLAHNLKDRFNVHFVIRQNQLVWLIQLKECFKDAYSEINSVEMIKSILESIQSFFEDVINVRITYAIYSRSISLNEFTKCYNKLSRCLNISTNVSNGAIITEKYQNNKQSILNDTYNDFLNVMNDLETQSPYLKIYLNEGKEEEYFKLFDKITTPALRIKHMNFPIAVEIYFSVLNVIMHYINFNHLLEKIAFIENPVELYNLSQYDSWDKPIGNLRKISTILFDVKKKEEKLFSESAIKKVKDYINLNMSENLSLNVLADVVGLNPYYLSRYFKKYENKNISAYIEEVKFERAKVMLANNELKIVDIAKIIGFESSSYFAIRFRKYQGMSPQEYRDKISKSGDTRE